MSKDQIVTDVDDAELDQPDPDEDGDNADTNRKQPDEDDGG